MTPAAEMACMQAGVQNPLMIGRAVEATALAAEVGQGNGRNGRGDRVVGRWLVTRPNADQDGADAKSSHNLRQ